MALTAPTELVLAVDASVLVGNLTRARGHELVRHPGLRLNIAEQTLSEVLHELPRRLRARERRQGLGVVWIDQMYQSCLVLVRRHITVLPRLTYGRLEDVARRRVPRDPNDWPTVALALTLECGIWTADADFLGCGIPTWTTETLQLHLDA